MHGGREIQCSDSDAIARKRHDAKLTELLLIMGKVPSRLSICTLRTVRATQYAERVDAQVQEEIDQLRMDRDLAKDMFQQHNG